MKAIFSEYLNTIAPAMKQLIQGLQERYDYVSILSTDSIGFTVMISQFAKSVSNSTMTTERGNVVRVYRNGLYSEYAFNQFDAENMDELKNNIIKALDEQLALLEETNTAVYETPKLSDEPIQLLKEMETGSMPETTNLEKLVDEGLVKKYNIDAGSPACFEYVGSGGHCGPAEECFHCKCEKCGRLIHLQCDELNMIKKHILDEHAFAIDVYRTVFYGLCEFCREPEKIEE